MLWTYTATRPGIPKDFIDTVQTDADLNDLVVRYLSQRRGTEALRRAFNVADEYLSRKIWAAELTWSNEEDGRWRYRVGRGRRKRRAIAHATRVAQLKADAVLVSANIYAY
jgi:hypothetical protein